MSWQQQRQQLTGALVEDRAQLHGWCKSALAVARRTGHGYLLQEAILLVGVDESRARKRFDSIKHTNGRAPILTCTINVFITRARESSTDRLVSASMYFYIHSKMQ